MRVVGWLLGRGLGGDDIVLGTVCLTESKSSCLLWYGWSKILIDLERFTKFVAFQKLFKLKGF